MDVGKSPDWQIIGKLKEMRTQYLFHNMRRDLKDRFYTLAERLDKYQTICDSTQTLVLRKIKEAVEKSHQMDVGVSLGRVRLGLEIVKDAIRVGSITLEQAILQGIRPSDFIGTKRKEWGEDLFIEVRIGGQQKNIGDFDLLYENVLDEIEKEPLCQAEMTQNYSYLLEIALTFLKVNKGLL